jgi:hypothetical protein
MRVNSLPPGEGFIVANFSFVDRLVDDISSALVKEIRAQVVNGKRKANGASRKRTKREMMCRVQGCKNRSKGPRFGYICDVHLKKLSKGQQRKAREKWNEKNAA